LSNANRLIANARNVRRRIATLVVCGLFVLFGVHTFRKLKIEAFPETETRFFFKIFDAQVTFIRNEKGDVTGITFEINGRTMKANRVNKVASRASNH